MITHFIHKISYFVPHFICENFKYVTFLNVKVSYVMTHFTHGSFIYENVPIPHIHFIYEIPICEHFIYGNFICENVPIPHILYISYMKFSYMKCNVKFP